MRKSFMSNIRDFVDTNVRHRIDKVSNNNSDFFDPDLLLVEGHFDELRRFCIDAEKRMAAILQSLATQNHIQSSNSNIASGSTSIYQNLSSLAHVASPAGPIGSINQVSTPNTPNLKCQSPSSLDGDPTFCDPTRRVNGISSDLSSTLTPNLNINSGSRRTLNLLDNKLLQLQQSQIKHNTPKSYEGGSSERLYQANKNQRTEEDVIKDIRNYKKLPIVSFLKFLTKSRHKLKHDSLLARTLGHCTNMQSHLTKLYLSYEQTVEIQCLKPIRDIIEVDVPNVIKLRKIFIKSFNDLESLKVKYNIATQKQKNQQNPSLSNHFTSATYSIIQGSNTQQGNINNKLDQLRREIDEATTKFEQARDTYAIELYAFVCKETELVNILIKFYSYLEDYKQQAANAIRDALPILHRDLERSPKRLVFGTRIDEHVKCIGRPLSIVIELCIHLLYKNGLHEEGLFRIPGSAVKIKKLKNAINAWFVTMASQGDLTMAPTSATMTTASASPSTTTTNDEAADQNQMHNLAHDSSTSLTATAARSTTHESGRGTMIAINNLFKEIASHKPRLFGDEDTLGYRDPLSSDLTITGTLLATSTGVAADSHSIEGGGSKLSQASVSDSQQAQTLSKMTVPPSSLTTTTTTSYYSQSVTIDDNDAQAGATRTCYDLPTIAGLLKLYLRELPEPLFTFDLHHEWISATVKSLNNQSKEQGSNKYDDGQDHNHANVPTTDVDTGLTSTNCALPESSIESHRESLEPIMNVLEKLPRANYDNLAHLIKFLHILTTHLDSNKMSASNLSITMAPSLIWAPPDHHLTASSESGSSYNSSLTTISGGTKTCIDPQATMSHTTIDSTSSISLHSQHSAPACGLEDQMQALNMQLTSVGMSTSLNALVIENLIRNADKIFPEPTKFQIPFLDNNQPAQEDYMSNNKQLYSNLHEVKKGHKSINFENKGNDVDSDSTNELPNDNLRSRQVYGHGEDDCDYEEDEDDNQVTHRCHNGAKGLVKSVSPTGLSTTSSSSFSSGSSVSHNDRTLVGVNNKKSLYKQQQNQYNTDDKSSSQQQSVQDKNKQQQSVRDHNYDKTPNQYHKQQSQQDPKPLRQPPPIPPLPKCKLPTTNYAKTKDPDNLDIQKQNRDSVKSPPPAISATNTKQDIATPVTITNIVQPISSTVTATSTTIKPPATTSSQPRAVSLRGTGSIPLSLTPGSDKDDVKIPVSSIASDDVSTENARCNNEKHTAILSHQSTANQNSVRPSVPPPSRPERTRQQSHIAGSGDAKHNIASSE